MLQAILFAVESYDVDIVIGNYKTAKGAFKALNKKYNELSASEKMLYMPQILVVK